MIHQSLSGWVVCEHIELQQKHQVLEKRSFRKREEEEEYRKHSREKNRIFMPEKYPLLHSSLVEKFSISPMKTWTEKNSYSWMPRSPHLIFNSVADFDIFDMLTEFRFFNSGPQRGKSGKCHKIPSQERRGNFSRFFPFQTFLKRL